MSVYRVIVFFSILSVLCVERVYSQLGFSIETVDSRLIEDYENHHLYNGVGYTPFSQLTKGSSSYADWGIVEEGALVFDGLRYLNVPLMYDLTQDVLVSRHPDLNGLLILDKRFVSEFELMDTKFVHIREDGSGLPDGFYRVLFQSENLVCYVKHHKVLEVNTYGSVFERSFQESVNYYVRDLKSNDGVFRQIKRHQDLLKINPIQRKAVRNLLRTLNLHFRNQPEPSLLHVLNYLNDEK